MVSQALAVLFGYLLGSIPTAYLIVRWKAKVDIRHAGSGNVGALNSYDVTRSKWVGVAVLGTDLLKGVAAVFVAGLLFGSEFSIVAAGGIGATVGHNFPVWLAFKGGRGLATAAGVMLTIAPACVLLWGTGWFAGYRLSKDVNVGNAIASILTLIAVLVFPPSWQAPAIRDDVAVADFRIFGVLLLCITLTRVFEPVREYFRTKYHN